MKRPDGEREWPGREIVRMGKGYERHGIKSREQKMMEEAQALMESDPAVVEGVMTAELPLQGRAHEEAA